MPSQCRDRIALSHELDCALTVFRPVQCRSAEHIAFRLRLAPERLAVAVSPPAPGLPRSLEPLRHPVLGRLCCHAVLASADRTLSYRTGPAFTTRKLNV